MTFAEWFQWVAIGLALVLGGFGLPMAAYAVHLLREELAQHRDGHRHDMNEAAVNEITTYLDSELRIALVPVNERLVELEDDLDEMIDNSPQPVGVLDEPRSLASGHFVGFDPFNDGEEE